MYIFEDHVKNPQLAKNNYNWQYYILTNTSEVMETLKFIVTLFPKNKISYL
jgi:hypothetical protein